MSRPTSPSSAGEPSALAEENESRVPAMSRFSASAEWAYRGIQATLLEGPKLRVAVLHGKGTDISEIVFKPLNVNLLFRNPWGPKSPALNPPVSPHSQMFRDYTGGGWSDVLPNAGDPCEVGGASFGLHDETPLLSWEVTGTEESGDSASASFRVELKKYPFVVTKKVEVRGEDEVSVTETVENASKRPLPYSWLVHPAFSGEFADGSARLEIPAKKVSVMGGRKAWPYPYFRDVDGAERDVRKVPSRETVLDSTLVLSGLEEGRYSLVNDRLGIAFRLSWDKEVFPYLWYYRSLSAPGYPYFGRSRFIALEPCTSASSGLASQIGADDAPVLQAGEKVTTRVVATVTSVKPGGRGRA
jgi:galactose mutarotase-like enzyme